MMETEGSTMLYLNHSEIDADHQKFITLVEQLKAADTRDFIPLFTHLLHHTQEHFQLEESLIERFSYPGKNEHHSEHNRLLSELRQLNDRVQKGRLAMARAYINERIEEWLNQHIMNMDAALVKYIEEQE